jgi:hypothetical protein
MPYFFDVNVFLKPDDDFGSEDAMSDGEDSDEDDEDDSSDDE